MTKQRLTIGLEKDLVEFLDSYQEHYQVSRSEVIRNAIELLREHELRRAYYEAGLEWEQSDDAKLWEKTRSDGITEHPEKFRGAKTLLEVFASAPKIELNIERDKTPIQLFELE